MMKLAPKNVLFHLSEKEYIEFVKNVLKQETGIEFSNIIIGIDDESNGVYIDINPDNFTDKECEICGKKGFNLQEQFCLADVIVEKYFNTKNCFVYGEYFDNEAIIYIAVDFEDYNNWKSQQ